MDFCTGMIGFLFGGPDSGQKIRKGLDPQVRDEGPALRNGQLFKDLSSSGRSSETARMQDWPSNWILSAEYAVVLTSPDLVRSRVMTFRMGPRCWSCAIIKARSLGSSQIPSSPNSTADHFGTGVAVSSLECGIHIYESPLIDCRDGKRDRAGTENLLKLVLGHPASLF